MRIAPGPASPDADFTDFESQIHLLETVAYDAVLRAFRVQADDLSWVHLTACSFLAFIGQSNFSFLTKNILLHVSLLRVRKAS